MASIRWTLFDTKINEEIDEEIKHHEQDSDDREMNSNDSYDKDIKKSETDKPTGNNEDDEVGVSDIVRNAFYTDMLKKINSNNQHFENKELYIKRLNELDKSLNIFMHSSKDILNSLDEEYANIIGDDNQRQQKAVYNYAKAVYKSINDRSESIDNNGVLEREISEAFSIETEIEEQFIEIRELIVACSNMANESNRAQLVQRVYRKVRKIPLYLGSPYRERCILYNRIQKYPKLSNTGHTVRPKSQYDTYKIVNMLMVGSSYDSYYKRKYQDILDYIEKVQKDACSSDTIESADKFDEAIINLNKLISKSTRQVKKKYSKLDGGCFSIIDLYLKNGDIMNYICFSGLFDFSCRTNNFIENKDKAKGLNKAIEDIAKTSEFTSSKIIKTTRNIRYYYKGSYMTLCKICNSVKSGHENIGGMFSCCERKFYTILEKYDVSDVDKYKMFTKYNACPMCEEAINDFKSAGYVDEIIFGISKSFESNYKDIYDNLAADIVSGKKKIVL